MKAIGTAMHTLGTRIIVMRCDPAQLPKLYADVISKRLKPVGKVVEVFGSVAAPYAAVHCHSDYRIAAGEKLFIAR
ncbi:MAG TPA: Gar1/Naf1 family protein [Methanoregulaceae archaeon]|nr:Gar1/Naf1 family protein [Methanoregulaceae archaeon]